MLEIYTLLKDFRAALSAKDYLKAAEVLRDLVSKGLDFWKLVSGGQPVAMEAGCDDAAFDAEIASCRAECAAIAHPEVGATPEAVAMSPAAFVTIALAVLDLVQKLRNRNA